MLPHKYKYPVQHTCIALIRTLAQTYISQIRFCTLQCGNMKFGMNSGCIESYILESSRDI